MRPSSQRISSPSRPRGAARSSNRRYLSCRPPRCHLRFNHADSVHAAGRATVARHGSHERRHATDQSQPPDHRGHGDVPGVTRPGRSGLTSPRGGREAVRTGHDVPYRAHHDVHEHRHVPRRAVPPLRRWSRSCRATGWSASPNVPAVCLNQRDITTIDLAADDLVGLAGHAVLVRTDHSVHFGTDAVRAESSPPLSGHCRGSHRRRCRVCSGSTR